MALAHVAGSLLVLLNALLTLAGLVIDLFVYFMLKYYVYASTCIAAATKPAGLAKLGLITSQALW